MQHTTSMKEIHVTISEKYHFHLQDLRNVVFRIIEILLTIFTSVGALAPAREAWRPNKCTWAILLRMKYTKTQRHKCTKTQISSDKDMQWACWLLMDRCGVLNAEGQETTARNEFWMFLRFDPKKH